MEILRVENLNFTYPNENEAALCDVSFSVENGSFTVICGKSGCGKTTLLRLLKKELSPAGKKTGDVYYNEKNISALPEKEAAAKIGFVMQNPNCQTVTDKVWHELAFGLENLGTPTEEIRRRVAETASYFGLNGIFRKKTDELSGGQKQLLGLASVTAMRPDVLLLDEPTGLLDPITASEFIATLKKLNRELGITIIAAEHRLEEVFPVADRVIVMDGGRIEADGKPEEIGLKLLEKAPKHPMIGALPAATRIALGLKKEGALPLTVRDGKNFIAENFAREPALLPKTEKTFSENAIEVKNVCFRYEKTAPDVLRDLSLSVGKNEIFCLLGGNGSGKTTALNVISGLSKPYRGKVFINGKKVDDYKLNSLYRRNLAYLPQDPQTVFVRDSVRRDMEELLSALDVPKAERAAKIKFAAERTGTERLLDKHPYDLSGGEQQKCAVAKILLSEPTVLLLDEPTKGLDAFSKKALKELIKTLRNEGVTVLAVTHDVEFAAEIADRCALLFDGETVSNSSPNEFFAGNDFYTTAANRIARDFVKNAVTCEEVVGFFGDAK